MFKFIKTLFLLCLCLQFSFHTQAQNRWRELSRPTDKLLWKLSFLDSLRGWVVGHGGAILKTTNGGTTWQSQNSGVTTDIQDVFMLNNRYGWAVTFDYFVDTLTWFGTRVLTTTNGGTSWTNRQYPVSGEFFNSIVFLDSLRGWMGGEFGHLVRTTNGGSTWVPVQVDSSIYAGWEIINVKFFTPQYGYAMGGRIDIIGVVWRTTDGGLRWTPDAISPEPVHDIHMIDSLSLIGIVGDVDYGASMVKTKNGGQRWDYTYLNIFGEPRALSFRTDAEAWSPLGFAGLLMYTRDTANTWTTIETPYRRSIYDLVFTDSSTGYAIGDSGMILKYSASTVNVEENALAAPISFALHQNYPNPFNPSTTISYDLPRESVVTLKVFNLLGEEVRTLVNQRKEAGRHLVNFDAEGLPSGVYLYRLQTETSTLSRKTLLLR